MQKKILVEPRKLRVEPQNASRSKIISAITLILRCESEFGPVKPIVLIHSACPCKSYVPQILHELHYQTFFLFFST